MTVLGLCYLQMLSVEGQFQDSHRRLKGITAPAPVHGFAMHAVFGLAPLLHCGWQLIQR